MQVEPTGEPGGKYLGWGCRVREDVDSGWFCWPYFGIAPDSPAWDLPSISHGSCGLVGVLSRAVIDSEIGKGFMLICLNFVFNFLGAGTWVGAQFGQRGWLSPGVGELTERSLTLCGPWCDKASWRKGKGEEMSLERQREVSNDIISVPTCNCAWMSSSLPPHFFLVVFYLFLLKPVWDEFLLFAMESWPCSCLEYTEVLRTWF